MKNAILISLLLNTYIFANINVVVSIMPQMTFVKAIGGDKVNVELMVEPGNSPHTYEPKPTQMVAVAQAQLYFSMGVEFEDVWLPKFKNLNKNITVIQLEKGIEKQPMGTNSSACSAHGSHESHAHHNHAQGTKDPHIWTSPKNVKIIAQNIYNALLKYDSKNAQYYKKNLDTFFKILATTDTKLHEMFTTYKGSRTFMVFHPSWGYFAKAYNLEQIAVEVEGKSPKPKELITLIRKAREKKVTAIFTQPEFSDTTAKIIANELNIPVVKISPMASNWSENLLNMAQTISGLK